MLKILQSSSRTPKLKLMQCSNFSWAFNRLQMQYLFCIIWTMKMMGLLLSLCCWLSLTFPQPSRKALCFLLRLYKHLKQACLSELLHYLKLQEKVIMFLTCVLTFFIIESFLSIRNNTLVSPQIMFVIFRWYKGVWICHVRLLL